MPEPVFSFRAINYLMRQLTAHDASWDAYFLGLGYEPLKVTYEELAESTEAVVRRVLEHLGIAAPTICRSARRDCRCRPRVQFRNSLECVMNVGVCLLQVVAFSKQLRQRRGGNRITAFRLRSENKWDSVHHVLYPLNQN